MPGLAGSPFPGRRAFEIDDHWTNGTNGLGSMPDLTLSPPASFELTLPPPPFFDRLRAPPPSLSRMRAEAPWLPVLSPRDSPVVKLERSPGPFQKAVAKRDRCERFFEGFSDGAPVVKHEESPSKKPKRDRSGLVGLFGRAMSFTK